MITSGNSPLRRLTLVGATTETTPTLTWAEGEHVAMPQQESTAAAQPRSQVHLRPFWKRRSKIVRYLIIGHAVFAGAAALAALALAITGNHFAGNFDGLGRRLTALEKKTEDESIAARNLRAEAKASIEVLKTFAADSKQTSLLTQANDLMTVGRLADAEAAYTMYARQAPQSRLIGEAWRGAAIASARMGNCTLAAAHAKKAAFVGQAPDLSKTPCAALVLAIPPKRKN